LVAAGGSQPEEAAHNVAVEFHEANATGEQNRGESRASYANSLNLLFTHFI